MAKVFITGSSQGLGLMAGQLLAAEGHEVVLHARDGARATDARRALPAAADVLVADVATLAAMRALAEEANPAALPSPDAWASVPRRLGTDMVSNSPTSEDYAHGKRDGLRLALAILAAEEANGRRCSARARLGGPTPSARSGTRRCKWRKRGCGPP